VDLQNGFRRRHISAEDCPANKQGQEKQSGGCHEEQYHRLLQAHSPVHMIDAIRDDDYRRQSDELVDREDDRMERSSGMAQPHTRKEREEKKHSSYGHLRRYGAHFDSPLKCVTGKYRRAALELFYCAEPCLPGVSRSGWSPVVMSLKTNICGSQMDYKTLQRCWRREFTVVPIIKMHPRRLAVKEVTQTVVNDTFTER
jgi:hypothetical protein